ncbi:hypothetical protein G7Y89_g12013 [Cudoniella acicularis]|uniref:Carrier domain-containing protein n=1 Tax=Cudoniella acicularis TaxID=354080 RepID=A0A8H4RC18_9HELO|nr:hypothetical protein G7Y89_g12013 [Cudoniella acicularis]
MPSCNLSQFAIGLRSTLSYSDPSNCNLWRNDRRMAIFQQENSSDGSNDKSSSGNNKLRDFLKVASANPEILSQKSSATFLAQQICAKLYESLLRPLDDEEEIDTSLSLADAGLDSLVAIDMRSWWKTTFGFDISVLEMLGKGSMDALGEHATKGLATRFAGDEKGDQETKEQDQIYVGKFARYVAEDRLKVITDSNGG